MGPVLCGLGIDLLKGLPSSKAFCWFHQKCISQIRIKTNFMACARTTFHPLFSIFAKVREYFFLCKQKKKEEKE